MTLTVPEEIRFRLGKSDGKWIEILGDDFYLPRERQEDLFASLYAGHHLIIVGPTGCGKTELARRISRLFQDIEVVADCPVHCSPGDLQCPWCRAKHTAGESLKALRFTGDSRLIRIQGSAELVAEDLMGGPSPEMAFKFGLNDIRAFSPGKLFRANRCLLLIDFLDRIPPRTLNAVLPALEGDPVQLGGYDVEMTVDTLVIGTSSNEGITQLSRDFIDHFDVIELRYIEKEEAEAKVIFCNEKRLVSDESHAAILEIIARTRKHRDLVRGISTRGGERLAELVHTNEHEFGKNWKDGIKAAAAVSLPHRVTVAPHAESYRSSRSIVEDVVNSALGESDPTNNKWITDDQLNEMVEEIVRVDDIRKPLKFGFLDILLKRLQRLPELHISRLYQRIYDQKQKTLLEDLKESDLTSDLLADIESARIRKEALMREFREKAQSEALQEALGLLEESRVLSAEGGGWRVSGRGILILLERLNPRNPDNRQVALDGFHRTGKRTFLGDGKTIGMRQYRFGDRYRDVSIKHSIREAIKKSRKVVKREDIRVCQRERRSTMDIVLVIDLSGTMSQMEKLWYAKESSIALAMASSRYGDRVGVVIFSNLARVAVPITDSPYKLAENLLDMELHENAFTNVGAGIQAACGLITRQGRRRANRHLILISDGDVNVPKPDPEGYALRQAGIAAKKGITISCVCINEESANPVLMKRISGIGKGQIYLVGQTQVGDALLTEQRWSMERR